MAKKRSAASGTGQRPNVPAKGSSSVNTNSFVKGMNKDITPSLENNQSWWHARNVANNSEDGDLGIIGNEPSNLACGLIPYTVIGAIHRYGDEWIVFSTDNTSSEIGKFDDSECKYTVIVNDPCLNFSKKFLITGAAKENFDCSWEVYWDDANNPSRSLNIDNIPWQQFVSSAPGDPCIVYTDIEPRLLDCEKIRLAPLVDTPCIELTKATDGGMLVNGTYQAFIAYTENEQRVTDYIGISNMQSLWSHAGSNSSLDLAITNLDQKYFYYQLVILRRNQGQTSAKIIGLYSTEQNSINLDYIDESLRSEDLKTIPMMSPAYEKSESMFVVNDWLIRQGPTEQFDFNYQPLANNIKTNWVINQLESSYYTKAGNKLGFMRDEQYSFFIRWIYNTGERSSSYHIPGRSSAPFNVGGTPVDERTVIGGDPNAIDSTDAVFQVYNTGNGGTVPNELQPDGSLIIARGEMGYWQSTEKYPSNRPDIWDASSHPWSDEGNPGANLCGEYIRHHKMPDETIIPSLHISTTNAENINVLGVEFTNITRPKYNNGTYITNVVGYEILRGSRQGARSILAKGMFKNMRKYDIPNTQNLLGTAQGLYPNYPYNSLQKDVFFHDGDNAGADKRTDGCNNSFTSSLNEFKPLVGYTDDVFTFHSPDLMFTKPFLNAYETKIYGSIKGKSTGTFTPSEDHPQFKLLRPMAATLATIIGVGYALNAVQGTTQKVAKAVQGSNADGNGIFLGTSNSVGTRPANAIGIGTLALGNAIWNVLLDDLIDGAIAIGDLYAGGIASSTQLNVRGSSNFVKSAIVGVTGGGIEEGVTYDKPEGNMPIVLRALIGISLAQKNITLGGNEVIELIYNLVTETDFVLKYNSNGFYNGFIPTPTNIIFRTKNFDSNYIGSSFQTFDGIKYKINNLFRPSTVAVSTEKALPVIAGTPNDNSRFALGGYVSTSGSVVDYGNTYLKNYDTSFKRTISAKYGALKYNMNNQYGQLDGIKQIQMRGCIELLDPDKPDAFKYSSKPIFSGDVFINRYSEKCVMPIFTNFLKGQPNEFAYDYSLYTNIPYPRFWLDSTRFDITAMAGEVATLGFNPGSWADAVPGAMYYLDRGEDTCQSTSLIGSLFGGKDDLNPGYNMKRAYMYTHVNGINEFFVESELNLAYRDWEDSPNKRFYDVYEYNDVATLFHADGIKSDNFYKYDDSLSPIKFPTQMSSFGLMQPRDYDPQVSEFCFVNYPKRLIYSLQAQEESKKDFWRVFLPNNYKDFKNAVSVIKPINKSGALIFFPYLSPQMFQGLDTLKTQLDTKLTIGDGGLFSQPFQNVANADISNEYGSVESLRGVINTPSGLFFISQQQGKIFQYGGKGLDPISNQGMKWWFNKYLPSRFVKQFPSSENSVWSDNPVAGVGCQVMYDSVDDIVYFMKKDYQLKSQYISDARFINSLAKPVRIDIVNKSGLGTTVSVDIGDPVYFDDCSWTISYDPKSKAWISFHDWHPELALPSINHFFTTKTITGTVPQCPPGYNFNPVNGLCEIGVNETIAATITVDDIPAIIAGGAQDCLLDIVIAMDWSGSTGVLDYDPNTGTMGNTNASTAQMRWLDVFLNDPAITTQLAAGNMQIGFTGWALATNRWTQPGSYSMTNTVTGIQACNWYDGTWGISSGGTDPDVAIGTSSPTAGNGGLAVLNDKANSQLGDRTADPFFKQILIVVTDGTNMFNGGPPNPSTAAFQTPNVGGSSTGAWANTNLGDPLKQEIYALFCGIGTNQPANAVVINVCSNTTYSPGNPGANQYTMNAQNNAELEQTAQAISGAVCAIPFTCDCAAGYTKVYQDPVTLLFTESTGICDDTGKIRCRKVTCECPPPTIPGTIVTTPGTCPDSQPLIYDIGDPSFVSDRQCNYFFYDSVITNYNVGGFWRHNVRCDSFVNYYGEDYPWEIDLISNTGQAVNTVRSFEYQLETYVYKGDPQYNMCGGDKWEDLDFNFDAAIVYNNDQVSGLLVLTPQPFNNPWGNLNYPIITPNNIDILVSKVEHKFRFNQFWDITNDRGEFTNVEQSIFNTDCNGYVRPLNTTNLNYDKAPTQRKKFRHYSNQVILRRNVSGNRKMLLRLYNTKLQLSMR
tara:strand:+ start:7649 stop:13942 length:6294 start_codon:yes stop_codon:yes gene_type:complete